MIAVAVSDGQLHEGEIELIRRIYQDQSGRSLTALGRRAVAKATKGDLVPRLWWLPSRLIEHQAGDDRGRRVSECCSPMS